MGIGVIIEGRSGTGKSSSLRGFADDEIGLVNVLGKPLPFRGNIKSVQTTDYQFIKKILSEAKSKVIVIDDCGYLITDMFMSRHANAGAGNGVFSLYNDIGDSFYSLIRSISTDAPADTIVYLMMHEDTDDSGHSKIKTIGKLLDEKVTVEGMVSIVLRASNEDGKYTFQTNGEGICKSPEGMFEDQFVPNDLKAVDAAIREYWEMEPLGSTGGKEPREEQAGQPKEAYHDAE